MDLTKFDRCRDNLKMQSGITPDQAHRIFMARARRIARMRAAGLTLEEIAKLQKCSKQRIHQIIKKFNGSAR